MDLQNPPSPLLILLERSGPLLPKVQLFSFCMAYECFYQIMLLCDPMRDGSGVWHDTEIGKKN